MQHKVLSSRSGDVHRSKWIERRNQTFLFCHSTEGVKIRHIMLAVTGQRRHAVNQKRVCMPAKASQRLSRWASVPTCWRLSNLVCRAAQSRFKRFCSYQAAPFGTNKLRRVCAGLWNSHAFLFTFSFAGKYAKIFQSLLTICLEGRRL